MKKFSRIGLATCAMLLAVMTLLSPVLSLSVFADAALPENPPATTSQVESTKATTETTTTTPSTESKETTTATQETTTDAATTTVATTTGTSVATTTTTDTAVTTTTTTVNVTEPADLESDKKPAPNIPGSVYNDAPMVPFALPDEGLAKAAAGIVVSFDANGGNALATTTITAEEDGTLQIPSMNPTRDGYVFNEWNSKADGSGTGYISGGTYSFVEDTKLYAQWVPESTTYTITFNGNGGSPATTTASATGSFTIPSSEPTLDGYNFAGWNTKADFSGATYQPGATVSFNEDTTLYAVWTYTIKYYNQEYGENELMGSETYFKGEIAKLMSYTTGDIFVSDWYALPPATGIYSASSNYSGGNISFRAAWEAHIFECSLYFFAEDCENVPNDIEGIIPGDPVMIPDDVPTRSGYIFVGWNTQADGTGETYMPGDVVEIIDFSLCLWAQMQPRKTPSLITFNANGGIGAPSSVMTNTLGKATLPSTRPTLEGYTFSGWNTQKDGSGTTYQPGATVSFDENTTLYAKWTYTITYHYSHEGSYGYGIIGYEDEIETYVKGETPRIRDGIAVGAWEMRGWNTGYYGDDVAYEFNQVYEGGNIDLYSDWYLVTVFGVLCFEAEDCDNVPGQLEDLELNAPVTIPYDIPFREGYVFTGWNTEDDFSGTTYQPGDEIIIDDLCVFLYAQMKPEITPLTITFDGNGGIVYIPSIVTDTIGEATLPSARPAREGYTFSGWNTQKDGSGTAYQPYDTVTVDEDTTLYAQWTPKTYKVSFNANGGEGGPETENKTHDQPLTIPSVEPTREGYLFTGWNTKEDGTGDSYVAGDSYSVEGKSSLYAQWTPETYEVVFDANGGNSAPETAVKTHGIDLVIPTAIPERFGYDFREWNVEADGSGDAYVPGENYFVEGDTTLYAQWIPRVYEITFDPNGGSDYMFQNKTHDTPFVITNDVPTRDGYEFIGWNTEIDGTGDAYAVGDAYTVEGESTLYAQWKIISFSVSFDANGGENPPDTLDKDYGDTAVIPETTPVMPGYTFVEWNTEADGSGTGYAPGDSYSADESTVLYAQYKKNTVISFDANGGSGAPADTDTPYNENIVIPNEEPVRDGYNFVEWNTEIDGSGDAYAPGSTYTIVEDETLYAQWDTIKYGISYSLNGGTNAPVNPTEYTVESEITLAAPTKDGYEFSGWYKESSMATPVDTILPGNTGNITAYAKWTAINYPISYELDGGVNNSNNPTSYTIEDETIVLEAPVWEGHTFKGWVDSDGNVITEIAVGSFGDITLFADWDVSSYDISYETNGGTNHPDNTPFYSYGDTITLLPATREGYDFMGWHTEEDLSDEVVTTIKATDLGDKTLYAEWKTIEYSITYEVLGAVNSLNNPGTYTVEDTIILEPATYEHYDFIGWYLDDNTFTQKVTEIEPGTTGELILYAYLTPSEYTVTYNLNGGINNPGNPAAVTFFDTTDLAAPTREHYEFVKWTDETGAEITSLSEIDEPITITAVWKAIEYPITYILNKGYSAGNNPTTYTVEDNFELKKAQIYGDFVFVSWTDESGKVVTYLAGDYSGPLTLKANFEYRPGSGNITSTGELPNAPVGLLIAAGLLAVVGISGSVILVAKRKNKDENEADTTA